MPIRGPILQMRENGHKCPQRELLREQRRLESKTQRRPCSIAKRVAAVRELTPTAGCNEVDPSGLLLGVQYGVQYLRGTVIFRVSLPKKHPGAREVAWSNITAKR